MPKAASKITSFRRQGITILVLLLALGTYVAVVVPSQKAFLIKRNFRVLADMGAQINEALANLGSSLNNAMRLPPNFRAVDTNGSDYLTAIVRDQRGSTNSLPPLTQRIQSALGLVQNLDLLEVTAGAGNPTNASGGAAGVNFFVRGAGKASWLELDYRGGASNVHVLARSDLSRLIEPIVNRGEFDDVLLLEATDASGTVLFQLGTSALQVSRLQVPLDRSYHTNLVNYAGAEYLVFTQPLQFTPAGPAVAGPTTITWILCGLVRSDRFATATRTVNYTVLVMFTFLALLLILSWPFLNVWSLGLKGGLRLAEVFLLLVATVAMNAFLTLMVLDVFVLQRIHGRADQQLEDFAGVIQKNLRTELRQIARQTIALNERFLTNAVSRTEVLRTTNLLDVASLDGVPYPYFGMATWIAAANGEQLVKWTVKEQPTPLISVGHRAYFQTVAESRPWLMALDDRTNSPRLQFCLEPIFSANTGENLATFSTRPTNDWRVVCAVDCRLLSLVNAVVPASFGFCIVDQEGKVLFHSDQRRNLRENFFEECNRNPRLRAAVLGRQTDWFDTRYANRDCNLFVTPLRDLPWSLVTFRDGIVLGTAQVEMVSVTVLLFLLYLGVFAATIGLTYVTGARRCLAWLWPTESRAGAYGLLTFVNLALAVAFAAAIFLPGQGTWRLAAAFVIPPFALLLCLRALSRGWLGSAWLRLVARHSRLRLPYRLGYVLTTGTLLLLVAMLPMVAFFKTAFDTETRLLVKHTQLSLAQDLELRAQRLWAEIYGITGAHRTKGRPLAVPSRRDFFSRRLTNEWDVYSEFFFDTHVRWTSNATAVSTFAPMSFLERWLPSLRPHYNEQDVRTRSVAGLGADDGAWFWTQRLAPEGDAGPGQRFELVKNAIHIPTRSGEYQLHIDSAEPRWGGISWRWALVLLCLLGVPFFVVYVIADKVLLLRLRLSDAARGCLLDSEHLESQAPFGPGKYLLLGPPRSGKSQQLVGERFARLQAGAFHRIDLRNPDDHKWLNPDQTDQLLRETEKAIVVDSLEYRHDDPEFTQKKLRFLRQLLLDEPRTVVVVSNIHPLQFTLAAADADKGKSEAAVTTAAVAWVDLLASFRKLYTRRRWDPGLFAAPEGQTSQKARALYHSIWWTCSPAEQEMLFMVAQGRLVSSYQPELTTLIERGLLRRDPALQLADEPFRRFVLSNYRPDAVVHDAVEEAPGLWQSLKGPAITVLIILAAFFFMTQKEMWNNSVLLITTFVGGIGAFAKAFEMFQKTKLKQTPPG